MENGTKRRQDEIAQVPNLEDKDTLTVHYILQIVHVMSTELVAQQRTWHMPKKKKIETI